MEHKKAILLTCGTALLWSLAGLNIKMIPWMPFAIAGGRSAIASLLLFPIIQKSNCKKIDKAAMGGALCYTAFNYWFTFSTKYATSSIAIMMQYTAPIYVAVLAWLFLKERITKTDIISMAFVLGGMLLFFTDSAGGGTTIGKVVAIFNGITFAGVSIFLRLQKDRNPVMSIFWGNVISAIIGIPCVIQAGPLNFQGLLFLFLAGFLCAFTYALYAIASTGLSALETVLLPVIDPVMNPVWVFLFLGEAPGIKSIIGASIVLVAVLAKSLWGLKH